MSDVRRYDAVANYTISIDKKIVQPFFWENPTGEFVRWENYDAVCETLAHVETERDASEAENDILKAEIDRLRKAGDAMASVISFAMARNDGKEPKLVQAWNDAKDGKMNI